MTRENFSITTLNLFLSKRSCSPANVLNTVSGQEIRIDRSGFTTRDLEFPNPYQFVKSEKYEEFSKLLIWRQKSVASVRHGNLLVVRQVSPGRVIVVLS